MGNKFHYIQHVPYEGLGMIKNWAQENNCIISSTNASQQKFPNPDEIDWLCIMGGPMGVYEQDQYPWMKAEFDFIEKCIQQNKIVLGICLGAQLIAHVLGAKVYPNLHKEIGWFSVQKVKHDCKVFKDFPDVLDVFQWHGDTFDIPHRANLIMSSEACINQAFIYQQKVLGLQFHLEMHHEAAQILTKNCYNQDAIGPYIQKPNDFLNQDKKFTNSNKYLYQLLTNLHELNGDNLNGTIK